MVGAIVNSGTIIGNHCIINTGVTIDHDCEMEDFIHISPGAHLGGTVKVGEESWIGLGASIVNNVEIGTKIVIGAGALVINDIVEPGTYVGVPAKKIK